MNNAQFFNDILLEGCILQVGRLNNVIAVFDSHSKFLDLEQLLPLFDNDNMYFLGGVDPRLEKERAKDTDILKKNYVYFDFDVRKLYPDSSNDDIKDMGKEWGKKLGTCSYVVFTGNGLHVYYLSEEPVSIVNKENWKFGLIKMGEAVSKKVGMPFDSQCVNLARIARMPGSRNVKSDTPIDVEIVFYRDSRISFDSIEIKGSEDRRKIEKDNAEKAKRIAEEYGEGGDTTFHAIQSLPVGEVVSIIMGWEFDGRNFYSDGKSKPKACFVPEGENYMVHGGTDHFPTEQLGYRPFDFVRMKKEIGNRETFEWFKEKFPNVAQASKKEVAKYIGNINDAFKQLENMEFEQLMMGGFWDKEKLMLRGNVTRLNDYSNIGKSKLAYYWVNLLCKNGYKGAIFSTEVTVPIVLANLLVIDTGFEFWDIVERKVKIKDEHREPYKRLSVYDVNVTNNCLSKIRDILKEEHFDFCVIDYVQAITPIQPSDSEYGKMTNYALEIQAIAQKRNICVIDLSQISNVGIKDENAAAGFIPSRGSGYLVSAADVSILIKRNKQDPSDHTMIFDIRKHKYMPNKEITLDCDFKRGQFSLFGSEFD